MEAATLKKKAPANNFIAGAKFETFSLGEKIVKVVEKEWDKFNVRLTSGQVFSKRMLNKHYKFVGMVDFSKNKKEISSRYRQMVGGDSVAYVTECKCGEKVSGWSEKEADENWDIHFCQ